MRRTFSASGAPAKPRLQAEGSAILRLAAPLLVNNLAAVGMITADTVMAGRLSALDLAAVALGANYMNLFFLAGIGMLMALSPTIAHAYGAGRDRDVTAFFRQALWLALVIGAVAVAGMLFVHPVLRAIDTPPDVAALAARYVYALCFGMPAQFAFLALRFSSEGIGWTRPIMYTALLGFGVNLLGNWLLLPGRWGLPALGAVGCGVATSCANWLMLVLMVLHVRRHPRYRAFAPLAAFERPDAARLREILHLGLPISIGVLAEGGLFACAGLVMGGFGASVIAAHAIAINYASLMFMVPLAVNSATAIHVGHRAGAGDMQGARFAGWTGTGLCVLFMTVSATVLVIARGPIAMLYSADPGVVRIATTLLLFAAVFQVADGLQVGVTGALRGFKDAQVPMWLCIASYWAFGFPLAYVAGIVLGGGPVAVWMGLIAGLFAAALTLTLRYRWVSTQAVRAGTVPAGGLLGSEFP